MDLTGKRIVVMGLGRFGGGVGVTRFLTGRGARVLVTDLVPAEQLRDSLGRLADLAVDYRLGEHHLDDFIEADLVVVNPAVDPRNNPFLKAAAGAGVPATSEIRLLVEHLPAPRRQVIGVTGTAGKSTITAMIGHALGRALSSPPAAGPPTRVWVGGNLGGSLLEHLGEIGPRDHVVLELSSFMLEGLDADGWSPRVAVVVNLMDNHLDRHETMGAYRQAKQTILRHQERGDVAVLGPDVAHWPVRGRRVVVAPPPTDRPLPLRLPGVHNQLNAALALAACEAALGAAAAPELLADFPGLPHRLQFVAEVGGVRFFNDSKATTPQAAMLALDSFPAGTVHVILGGYDKHSDLTALAQRAAEHARALYTIGATGERLAVIAQAAGARAAVHRCGTLAAALSQCAAAVRAGEVVLLSPGCASWDQFENYEKRGEAFVAAVQALQPAKA